MTERERKLARAALGEVIRRLRTDAQLHRSDLGRVAGFSERYIENIEMGRHQLSFTGFLSICAALSTPPSAVMSKVEEITVEEGG